MSFEFIGVERKKTIGFGVQSIAPFERIQIAFIDSIGTILGKPCYIRVDHDKLPKENIDLMGKLLFVFDHRSKMNINDVKLLQSLVVDKTTTLKRHHASAKHSVSIAALHRFVMFTTHENAQLTIDSPDHRVCRLKNSDMFAIDNITSEADRKMTDKINKLLTERYVKIPDGGNMRFVNALYTHLLSLDCSVVDDDDVFSRKLEEASSVCSIDGAPRRKPTTWDTFLYKFTRPRSIKQVESFLKNWKPDNSNVLVPRFFRVQDGKEVPFVMSIIKTEIICNVPSHEPHSLSPDEIMDGVAETYFNEEVFDIHFEMEIAKEDLWNLFIANSEVPSHETTGPLPSNKFSAYVKSILCSAYKCDPVSKRNSFGLVCPLEYEKTINSAQKYIWIIKSSNVNKYFQLDEIYSQLNKKHQERQEVEYDMMDVRFQSLKNFLSEFE